MAEKQQSTARLEAFSDGVIAVIITIMVLELKVPRQDGMAGLNAILPTLLVYLLSFAFTGIYWVNHNHLIKRIETADNTTVYANLIFLFWLSLLPFFTNDVIEKREIPFSVGLYAFSMMVTAFSFLLLRLAVLRQLHYFGKIAAQDSKGLWMHVASLGLYVVTVFVAHRHAYLALALIGAITAPWIVPNLSQPTCPPPDLDDRDARGSG
jgi:uncharacterized membrane protein